MRLPRTTESEGEIINMSSLLDVMFILLIFFMATTTFKREEFDVKVNLPQAQSERAAISAQTKLIVINVRGVDRKKEDPLYVVASRRATLQQLQEIVENAVKKNVGQKVLIRGDKHAYHGQVAKAVAACRAAGVLEVNMGYDYKID